MAGTPVTSGSTSFATGEDVTGNVYLIPQPTGGVGQFKGLGKSDKHVEVVCKGVVIHTETGDFKAMLTSSTNNGFMISCYTGIRQCSIDVTDYATAAGWTAG